MTSEPIRFDDGAAYERFMGVWSRAVGATFLDWLAPRPGLRWLDVGCGNGAFTERIVERCAPASVDGIDPSDAQLAFARTRPAARLARFRSGDAMALSYPDDSFDVAVMPLVIFFVPDPAKGIAEMARVVAPGGLVAAYAWDMLEGGFPYDSLLVELESMGLPVPKPPSPGASRIAAMQELWAAAGLEDIETRVIPTQRTFADPRDYFETIRLSPSVGAKITAMPGADIARLESRLASRFVPDSDGRIVLSAFANAVRGRVRR